MASENIPDLDIDPRSGYGMADLVRMFLAIGDKPLGRTALMKELKLGEATVKTMFKFLRSRGLVEQDTRGIRPTDKGRKAFSCCSSFSGPIGIDVPEFSKVVAALIVKKGASKVSSGIEQRDEGVKAGAKIITLVKKDCRLMLAGVPDHDAPYTDEIGKSLDAADGDVVILSGADSLLDAERGAVAAGLSVLKPKKG